MFGLLVCVVIVFGVVRFDCFDVLYVWFLLLDLYVWFWAWRLGAGF